jgi:C2H2-type zinc finger
MARSRTVPKSRTTAGKSTAKSGTSSATPATGEFKCSVCGRTFGRAAALGAHRRRAHGIPGAASTVRASKTRTPRARASATRDGRAAGANRDTLLAALFPQGIPPRENVMRAVDTWLQEADRLSRMR